MPDIRPFRAVRPRPDKVKEVASPPYDVLSSDEARRMAEGKPDCFLHVTKPEIDLPPDTDFYGDRVYATGRANFKKMLQGGVLFQEMRPAYYFYRLIWKDVCQVGLAAALSTIDYDRDLVKKHELTRIDKELDRSRHIKSLNANAGPVFLTYRAREDMARIAKTVTGGEPVYDFTSDDGIRHSVWKESNLERIEELTGIFAGIPNLYVADGHHRSAAAARVARERRSADAASTGREEYNYFLAVIFPHDQLRILPYNRVVEDLNGLSREDFMRATEEKFVVEPSPQGRPVQPSRPTSFGMCLGGKWHSLVAREGSFPENHPVKSLDVAILQDNLLAPVLGITDPRKDKRIDFVGGIRGLEELSRRVDGGEGVAFSLYPTSVEQLIKIADAGEIMPPKSTWFEPKLRCGIIVHLLD